MTHPNFVKGLEGLVDRDTLLSMSGQAFMEGIRDGTLPAPPISKGMNYRLETVEHGRIVFRGTPGFDHTNPMGTVHGGWYGTLLDSAMACAVMTTLPKGAFYTTLEYKINITRPIPLDSEILCEGLVQHAGRRTGVANGTIIGATNGKLYATGSTTCIVMQA